MLRYAVFQYLCIEFPLQAYCGGSVMGNKNCLADIHGCLSIVLRGFGKELELPPCHHERIWKLRLIYWAYAGTEPVSLYSSSVSCVHVIHGKQGSKYTHQ